MIEKTRKTWKRGWERLLRRSLHPTAGSRYTAVLGPVEPPIYVKARPHDDKSLDPGVRSGRELMTQ